MTGNRSMDHSARRSWPQHGDAWDMTAPVVDAGVLRAATGTTDERGRFYESHPMTADRGVRWRPQIEMTSAT